MFQPSKSAFKSAQTVVQWVALSVRYPADPGTTPQAAPLPQCVSLTLQSAQSKNKIEVKRKLKKNLVLHFNCLLFLKTYSIKFGEISSFSSIAMLIKCRVRIDIKIKGYWSRLLTQINHHFKFNLFIIKIIELLCWWWWCIMFLKIKK